jgi:beta-lysine 5,6-aminomutase alpha subunit
MELRIDSGSVDRCRELAASIVAPVEEFIASHSTVAVERSVLRLLGVDGVGPDEIPVPNLIVDALTPDERSRGVALAFGKAVAETGLDPAALGAAIAAGTYALAQFASVRTSRPRSHASARAATNASRFSNAGRNCRRRCST